MHSRVRVDREVEGFQSRDHCIGLIIAPLVLAVLLLSHMLDIFPPSADTEAMQFIDQYYIMSEMLEWAGHVGVKYGSHVGVKCGNHA